MALSQHELFFDLHLLPLSCGVDASDQSSPKCSAFCFFLCQPKSLFGNQPLGRESQVQTDEEVTDGEMPLGTATGCKTVPRPTRSAEAMKLC